MGDSSEIKSTTEIIIEVLKPLHQFLEGKEFEFMSEAQCAFVVG